MSAVGDWILHYSWGNANNFGQAPISLKGDGTFSGPGAGNWRQQDGTILLSFAGGPAKYGGTVDANVASGAMSTFAGLTGSWYMLKQGVTGVTSKTARLPIDPAGNKF
ncbi:hypothetical protein [Amycolatopsis sp. CA-230715]|uniref:hypothetical protein n=1 Tax=Amycolatopsis sp. CA-230715 TaxID=2745196 RepID=UPI001C00ADC7|nr:hypothetical protein [Amycolatopsis sp. CA-230715]QWF85184.1 hypothetical protein HUW46_08638 [Amycolatopsis sp. CA-230715]